jgi:hypothetical protein
VRRNWQTVCPLWLKPVVATVTMPTSGRDAEARTARTSDREYSVSPSKTGCGSRTSSQDRLAMTFCETSDTDWPVTSASVKVLFTSGRPNSVWAA